MKQWPQCGCWIDGRYDIRARFSSFDSASTVPQQQATKSLVCLAPCLSVFGRRIKYVTVEANTRAAWMLMWGGSWSYKTQHKWNTINDQSVCYQRTFSNANKNWMQDKAPIPGFHPPKTVAVPLCCWDFSQELVFLHISTKHGNCAVPYVVVNFFMGVSRWSLEEERYKACSLHHL